MHSLQVGYRACGAMNLLFRIRDCNAAAVSVGKWKVEEVADAIFRWGGLNDVVQRPEGGCI